MNWHSIKNELSFWYPLLQKSGVLTPKTEIVPVTCESLFYLLDNENPKGYEEFFEKLKQAVEIIGLPAFIRTGISSGKHFGYCFLDNMEQLPKRLFELTEWSACADIMGLPLTEFAIRERLNLETAFVSFHGLPINKERRYFFKDGLVVCHHPYWIPYALEGQNNLPENWRALLDELNNESKEEIEYLTLETQKVAAHFEGAWSLDWALTKEGKWYAIDMAIAKESFHWDDCPFISQINKQEQS